MHWQIVETAEQLTRRYVANRSHCVATLIRLTVWEEPNKRTQCYLASYSGLGGIPLPSIGSMGGEYGPLGRRYSGKGRVVPVRCPSIFRSSSRSVCVVQQAAQRMASGAVVSTQLHSTGDQRFTPNTARPRLRAFGMGGRSASGTDCRICC